MDNGQIVVVGLGNILLGDEGIGVHAVSALEQRFPHPQVAYYDGGTKGLTLLPFMEEASYLLLLDAVWTRKNPGTIVEIANEGLLGSFSIKFSAHDIALPDLLALLRLRRGSKLHRVALLGMVPDPLTSSTELSPRVQKSFSRLVTRAERILQTWTDGIRGFPEERSTARKASRR